MKSSTMIVLVLMVPAMLGYLIYGWLLYQTITSESNTWIKTLFATDTVKSFDLNIKLKKEEGLLSFLD